MVSFWTKPLIFWIFMKTQLMSKGKGSQKLFRRKSKILSKFKNVAEQTQKFQSHLSRLVHSKIKIFSVGPATTLVPLWFWLFCYL